MLTVKLYRGSDQYALYTYWRALGEHIPYFFPVSPERWAECLLEDNLDGEFIFDCLKTYVAKDDGQMIGFAQVGHPRFSWDANGLKVENPQLSHIRHFYFDRGRVDVASELHARVQPFLDLFPHRSAFFHAYGMSCNAHHGKLYMGLEHVDAFVRAQGFQIEHENVIYDLAVADFRQSWCGDLSLMPQPRNYYEPYMYKIWLRDTWVGTLQVRYMDLLNGEAEKDEVYLTLMAINRDFRGQGWGTQALLLLCRMLQEKGYQHLYLDTAHTNVGAQRFYERFGFKNRGRSRSYQNTGPALLHNHRPNNMKDHMSDTR
ncbi:MAG: GNAT family N-acetyltransferase [Anaerolineae bacterium]|nr:GNAT family N-acetyltransferase [Anaerolineae bacterium]